MKLPIETLIEEFEKGQITRRQFVAHLSTVVAVLAGVSNGIPSSAKAEGSSLFQVSELNHIAMRVTDLDRSQKFYEDTLGMKLILKRSAFRMMGCGPHFLALFKGVEPRLDHLAFTLPTYNQAAVVEKLKAKGLEPRLEEGRTYFRDPDGFIIQIEHPEAWPDGSKRPEPS